MKLERILYKPPLPDPSPESLALLIPAPELRRLLKLDAIKDADLVVAIQAALGTALRLLEEQYGVVGLPAEFRWSLDASDGLNAPQGRYTLALPVAPVTTVSAIRGGEPEFELADCLVRNGYLSIPAMLPLTIEFTAGWPTLTDESGGWQAPHLIRLAVARICQYLVQTGAGAGDNKPLPDRVVGALLEVHQPRSRHAGIVSRDPNGGGTGK